MTNFTYQSHKFDLFDIELWPLRFLKLNFLSSRNPPTYHKAQFLQDHYANVSQVGSRSQNRPQMANFRYQSPKIGLFDIGLAFETHKIEVSVFQNKSNIPQDLFPISYSIKIDHRWIGSQNRSQMTNLRYQSPKIDVFDIELAFQIPKI